MAAGRYAGCNRVHAQLAVEQGVHQGELAVLLEEIRVDTPVLLLADAVHALGDSIPSTLRRWTRQEALAVS